MAVGKPVSRALHAASPPARLGVSGPTMKIAYLINQYPKVSHAFIRTEIQALEARGHSVTRIALRGWDAEVVDPADADEARSTRYVLRGGAAPLLAAAVRTFIRRPAAFLSALLTAWRLSRGGERGLAYHLIYILEACLVVRWTDAAAVAHLHAHFGSNGATVARLVHVLGGPPFSFTVHGPEEFDKPLQWKLREKVAAAKAVVAISSFGRSQLYRWSDQRDWPKLEVVHCALDPRFVAIPATEPPDNHTLVCVGRLCEQKGQLLLIQAIAEVRRRGVPVQLVLAGDGEMRDEIAREIAAAGLEDAVTITGWIGAERVRAELENARALILPSFAEGLPVVIMEAMARQRPVITTYVAGIPELVRDGKEGLLVPAGDRAALADAICTLMAMSPAALSALGRAAAERVLVRHSAAVEAAKLAAIFAADPGPADHGTGRAAPPG